jgi:hypothetical protein
MPYASSVIRKGRPDAKGIVLRSFPTLETPEELLHEQPFD